MRVPTVCIDARMAAASGIGTYLEGLLTGLKDLRPSEFRLLLLGDPNALPAGPWSCHPSSSPIYSLQEQIQIPRQCRAEQAALLHAPHYNLPILLAGQTVVTVHDLIHLKFPQFWPSRIKRGYARFFFHFVVPRARAILTVSENTKRDLIEMLAIPADRITVTYPAVHHEAFGNPDQALTEEFQRLGLPKDYILYVGNLKEFKNIGRLLEAYRQLRRRRKDCSSLVLVGRNFMAGFERELQNAPGVRWVNQVRRNLLPHVYRNALFFVFPSLYEGFGLPPLEAMAGGTPVLCSNRGSLPEVVGQAAMLIDAENVEDISSGMERLMDDKSLRADLAGKGLQQAKRFSWNTMTRQTLKVYRECLT